MAGLKPIWLEFMHFLDLKGTSQSSHLFNYLQQIYDVLEDVYSVASMTELQTAIDGIGTGAGTIFIEAGTHVVDIPIDIDGGGSVVIYGHGDNTILLPDDGINVFNITDCASCIIKTLQIDATNYTGATSAVIVDEVNDNVITIEDVTIVGNNLGTGIELVSNNCIIEHCNIDNMLDGIYLNNSNRHIIAQNTVSNNARYGIYLDTVLYSNIGNNTCTSNLMGIFVDSSTNNSISNNICNQNTENGIYLTASSYNTVSGNTCENNDSNTINAQAGMFITTNSDYNTISANSCNNNNNAGAGIGYGIIIALDTCNENIIASNNANGNDINLHDSGTDTTIEYYVQDEFELQDAIDSIGDGSGIITINVGTMVLSATINININGFVIIQGQGYRTVLDAGADRTVFNITATPSGVIIRNLRIDATDLTNIGTDVIVSDAQDCIFENLYISGDGVNGDGIVTTANALTAIIKSCNIVNLNKGIVIGSNQVKIIGNRIYGMASTGIEITTNNVNITSNTIHNNGLYGIHLNSGDSNTIVSNTIQNNNIDNANNGGGIWIDNDSNYNMISGNVFRGNANIGVGISYGIRIDNVNCDINTIGINHYSINNVDVSDAGTGTIYGWNGWFDDGVNFRVTVVDGIITAVANSTGGGHNP